MKKWETINQFKVQSSKFKVKELIKILLENRGIKTKKEIEEFLEPKLESVTVKNVGINEKQLKKSIERIKKAIENKERVIVFGDYDADGICATAILWETLHGLGANAMPYIPHRIDEGYGLSKKGISNIQFQISNVKLIITVDNGIVANEAVEFANSQGIDVVITDHHVKPQKLPNAFSIVHTTKLCGAGVAYLLAQEIKNQKSKIKNKNDKKYSSSESGFAGESRSSSRQAQTIQACEEDNHLELVALATIADMVPLTRANRTLVKFGMAALKKTKRVGLIELFKEAILNQSSIGVYEVGHIIAPRLNAMGRLDYAMDSLRLLCTKDKLRGKVLADKLGRTNRERQELTIETSAHASAELRTKNKELRKLLFIAHETYQPGVIGLVAGKLVDEFYRPAIVLSIGEKYSKASARSVHGFNIVEFIRTAEEYLIDCGGHPMAAGFTVETEKISILREALEKKAQELLDDDKLTRTLRIDCEILLLLINGNFYDEIQKLSPFGVGNPEPSFVSRNVFVEDIRTVGYEGKHLKIKFRIQNSEFRIIEGIGFGLGEKTSEFHIGDSVDIVFTIDENIWNGNKDLQLKIKDIRKAS